MSADDAKFKLPKIESPTRKVRASSDMDLRLLSGLSTEQIQQHQAERTLS